MSLQQPRSRIYLALFIAVMLACGLYFIGRGASLTSSTSAQSFWAANVADTAALYQSRSTSMEQPFSVTVDSRGVMLSHIWTLPAMLDFQDMAFDGSGKIYLEHNSFTVYDPHQQTMEELFWVPDRLQDAVIGQGDRIYTLGYDRKNAEEIHFSIYDPVRAQFRDRAAIGETIQGPLKYHTKFLIVGQDGRVYGLRDQQIPAFVYDPASDSIDFDPSPQAHFSLNSVPHPVLSQDGLLYGATASEGRYLIFAYDLANGLSVTRELPARVSALTPRSSGGVYIGLSGVPSGVATFDPRSGQGITVSVPTHGQWYSVRELAERQGKLYGLYQDIQYREHLFEYDPHRNAFEELEIPRNDVGAMRTGPDDQVYLKYAHQWLATWQPERYAPAGLFQSNTIAPTAIVLTHTQVGDMNSSVRALMCDQSGRVYGTLLNATQGGWLFAYDPQSPAKVESFSPQVAAENKRKFLGGTEIIALADDRLAGGTNSGHVFIYDPPTAQTLDLGQPATDTLHVTALTQGPDGLIYGGTSSFTQAHLFSLDPATGRFSDIALPLIRASLIEAIVMAPDGRLYAGVDSSLIVYDPATRQATLVAQAACPIKALTTTSDGTIYVGCGNRLLAYVPSSGELTKLAETSAEIATLTIGSDGHLYGSVFHEYSGRCVDCLDSKIFAYDPAAQRMTNLGIDFPTGPVILAACPDGTIYGGSNTTDSNYMGPSSLFAFRADCRAGIVGSWDRLTWEADTPPGTSLTVDVLDEKGEVLLSQVSNGGSLQAIDARQHPTVRLRANLSTVDPHVTPVLKRWRVDYTFACQK